VAHYNGRLVELLLEPYQNAAARIACPAQAELKPGQYLQAHQPNQPLEVTPTSLFRAGESRPAGAGELSFPVAGPLPESWQPGAELKLRGPLGRGFELPKSLRRLALVALGESPARLMPLIPIALERGVEIVLVCDAQVGELPLAVESQSVDDLPKALAWADFLAIDIPLERLEDLAERLTTKGRTRAPEGQALVFSPMPCGGLAKCGVCSLTTKNGLRLACEDGPVFGLHELS